MSKVIRPLHTPFVQPELKGGMPHMSGKGRNLPIRRVPEPSAFERDLSKKMNKPVFTFMGKPWSRLDIAEYTVYAALTVGSVLLGGYAVQTAAQTGMTVTGALFSVAWQAFSSLDIILQAGIGLTATVLAPSYAFSKLYTLYKTYEPATEDYTSCVPNNGFYKQLGTKRQRELRLLINQAQNPTSTMPPQPKTNPANRFTYTHSELQELQLNQS